jgi:alpha-amylase
MSSSSLKLALISYARLGKILLTCLCLFEVLSTGCSQSGAGAQAPAPAAQPPAATSAIEPRALEIASAATTAPAPLVNGVLLEGFYWNTPISTPNGTWWDNLAAEAPELASAGFTAIWLPPPYKGQAGVNDVGYGVYDRYDLGEFNQKGSVATRYGTLADLQAAIAAFKAQHVQVYADIVMNHMMGADQQDTFQYNGQNFVTWTHFTFPGRGTTYSNYTWQYFNFNGIQQGDGSWLQWNPWDFQPYANGDAYDNLMGCEIRYSDPNNCAELVKWGNWITSKLQLDGYRLDATPHIYTPFINQWLDQVKGPNRFAVSEAWMNNLTDLENYAGATGGRTSLFDFPLHNIFTSVLNSGGDMRQLRFAGFTEANGALSVSFVDNHDTDGSSPVVTDKMLAYAYIFTRDKGYPCVFYKDYYVYGLGARIKRLIQLRREHAYGGSFEYDQDDPSVYVYSRAGDASHTGLLVMLDDNTAETKTITTPWPGVTLHDGTGNQASTVTTDATGVGSFPIGAHSYSVWIQNN